MLALPPEQMNKRSEFVFSMSKRAIQRCKAVAYGFVSMLGRR